MPANVPLYRLVADEEKQPGGLLLLSCATRTIISPVYVLIQYYVFFSVLGGLGRVLLLAPVFVVPVLGDGLLTAMGIWSGILIWKARAFGVRLAKWYLVLSVVYPVIVATLLLKFGQPALAHSVSSQLLMCWIPNTLWFIYLSTSDRVKTLCEKDRARTTSPA